MGKTLTDFLYGGDYNPDQWPKETWSKDIHIFKQAEINSATINIFHGHCLSPKRIDLIFQSWIRLLRSYLKLTLKLSWELRRLQCHPGCLRNIRMLLVLIIRGDDTFLGSDITFARIAKI